MYYDDENFGTYNDTHAQRTHLQHRATDIHCEKCAQFRKDFYINADESPRTPKEYVERIKAGKFLIGKGLEDEVSWNPERYIQWRDPNHPADEEGYKAAVTKVDDLYTKTNDDIAVLDPKDALQSLRVFEDTTFH